jgi:L-threonylcarbamoyladenylate synthase
MQTHLLSVADAQAQARALALLDAGEVIAAPTDTVYGVMCRFDSTAAIERLYVAKDRPPQKAIPVLISGQDQLALLVCLPLPPLAVDLAHEFWPGALTLILPALDTLPANLTAGQPTVAVRMPDHGWLRALIRHSGPLAATSANRSGSVEAHTAAEVLAQLDGRIPLVVADDEPARPRALAASTIVDLAGPPEATPAIVREGPLGAAVRRHLNRLFET